MLKQAYQTGIKTGLAKFGYHADPWKALQGGLLAATPAALIGAATGAYTAGEGNRLAGGVMGAGLGPLGSIPGLYGGFVVPGEGPGSMLTGYGLGSVGGGYLAGRLAQHFKPW